MNTTKHFLSNLYNKTGYYLKLAYTEYKTIIVSYIFLIFFMAVFYSNELYSSIMTRSGDTILAFIRHESMVYLPLIALACLCLCKVFKKKDFKISDGIIGVCILIIFLLASTVLLDAIYRIASVTRVIYWSNAFMELDKRLFGTYPAFWLIKHTPSFLEKAIVFVYNYMPTIMACWLAILMLFRKPIYLNEFIKNVFLAFVVCFPFWIIFPVICPAQMYLSNILHQPLSPSIAQAISTSSPSPYLVSEVLKYVKEWTDMSGKRLAVSTFPSMHTIWGILLAYSIIMVVPKRKYKWIITSIAVLIALLNTLGTVYLLQHYAVDVLAGIIMAIVVIKIEVLKRSH